MPDIRCVKCGEKINIDAWGTPYKGELGCPQCSESMLVHVSQQGSEVKRKNPSLEDITDVLDKLTPVENKSLQEASLSLGGEAIPHLNSWHLELWKGYLEEYTKQIKH